VIYPVLAAILFLFAVFSGCVTEIPDSYNLTEGELADRYLAHAAAIRDLHSEYVVYSGMSAGNPSLKENFVLLEDAFLCADWDGA